MAASLKISELNELTALADQDLFLVTDSSATTSKKVTYASLKTGFGSSAETVLGISSGDTSMGAFSGTAVGDNLTVKQIFQALATKIDAKQTLLGVSSETSTLGTFTGSTIADNQNIKQALQSLETKLELFQPSTANTFTAAQTLRDKFHIDPGDGGLRLQMNRNTSSTQMDILLGNVPSGARLNINTVAADASDALVIYSSKFWVRAIGGGTGDAEFDGDVQIDGNLTFDSVALTAIQTSGESFADNDTSLMTSAAIDDRIAASGGSAAVSGVTAGTVAASKAVIVDANKDITGFRNLSITGNLSVQGTTTTVDTVTMTATNAIAFEGATADDHETTLTIVNPTADRTIKLPDQSGCLPVLAADSTTAITSTPEELNVLDGITSTVAELNILDGVTSTAAELNILDGVTSTAAELNILDGVTATAAELNILDGVTATAAELNILDGVTSTAAELNILDGVTATAAELNILDGVTSTAAELNILDGVTATAAEINVLDGATAGTAVASKALVVDSSKDLAGVNNLDISGNLDVDNDGGYYLRFDRNTSSQIDIITGNIPSGGNLNIKNSNGNNAKVVVYSDLFWVRGLGGSNGNGNAEFDGNVRIDGNLNLAGTDVTATAAELNILDGVTSTAAELNILDGVTSTAAELNILDGVTATAAELNILDGVTATAAELNILDGVTATAAELNALDGITSTVAELNILDGVTSTAAELNLLDGSTAGTVVASKAVVVDANKDAASFRNVTLTGELDAATLDISGDADIDGTTNLDAVDIDGDVDLAANITFSGGARDILLTDNTADALEVKEGSNQYMSFTSTDDQEKVEIFKNLHLAGERLFFDSGTQLIRLSDNKTSALKIENHDGSHQDFLDFKTANSGTQLIFGAPNQFNNTITVGVDDTGYDVKFFGATASAYLLWDESEDDLILGGAARVVVPEGNLVLGSTAVTSTAAELNILDGVTATTAELNILDGVTATTAELNILDGVTATAAELNYSDGVTSNIQTQLDAKLASSGAKAALDVDHLITLSGVSAAADDLGTFTGSTINDNVTIKAALQALETKAETAVGNNNTTLTGTTVIAAIDLSGDIDVDGTANLDAVDIDGAVQIDGTVTVGVDDTGYDVKFFGATASAFLLWDESADDLILSGDAGLVVPEGQFTLGSTAVTSTAAELNLVDGITAGTVSASKAVIVDSDKDVTGFRNVTLTGELDAATLDISGDADIDGTTNLDAVDIDGDVDLAGDLTFSAAKDIQLVDNNAAALEIAEAGNNYLTFVTTNSSEKVEINQNLTFNKGSFQSLSSTANRITWTITDNDASSLMIAAGGTGIVKFDTQDDAETIFVYENVVLDSGATFGFDDFSSAKVDRIQASGSSFANNDTSIMTSAAIEDKIQADTSKAGGTWTATLEGAGGAPGSKVTATGNYARMGDIVLASVHFNSVDTSSYSGAISISGLPVTSKNTATATFMGQVYNDGMISGATDSVQALVADNGTTISFLENANSSALNWGTVGAGKSMRVQVQYIAA